MDYHQKLQELKRYIPFLEGMIRKLSLPPDIRNPRHAQLEKLKTLREILIDKKKRMNMEKLEKCEQVLISLYAKVEKDTLPGISPGMYSSRPPPAPEPPSITELDVVRTKLKSATMTDETLPEIARRSETEEICTAGSKEPALFHRRQAANMSPSRVSRTAEKSETQPALFHRRQAANRSPSRDSRTAEKSETPKRNRVLISPDRHWKPEPSERPLYKTRSPRKSPVRSPKKNKGKFSKHSKGMDITLSVPVDSLDNVRSEDIVSRIVSCNDNDVDIDTLRDLRKQILGELKDTGAKEDISDLILKSYKKKKKSKNEVEDGEISDSESDIIDKIYGGLKNIDKNKPSLKQSKTSDRTDKKPREVRKISVVLNNADLERLKSTQKDISVNDIADYEMTDDVQINTADKQKEVSAVSSKSTLVPNKESKGAEFPLNKKAVKGISVNHIADFEMTDDVQIKTADKHKEVSAVSPKSLLVPNKESKGAESPLNKKVEIICIDNDENTVTISAKPKETQEKRKHDQKLKETLEKSKTDPKPKETQKICKSDPEKSDDDDVSFVGCSTVDETFLLETSEGKISRPFKSFKPNFYNEQESSFHIQKNPEIDSSKAKTTNFITDKIKPNAESEQSKDNTTIKESQKSKRKTDEISTVKMPSNSTDNTDPTGDVKERSGSKTVNKENDKNPEAKSDTKQIDGTKAIDSKTTTEKDKTMSSESKAVEKQTEKTKADAKIVSEIDILQALKNDILNGTITIPGAEPTPVLQQPKFGKVVNSETITKRTISIEKYKQKLVPGKVTPLFPNGPKCVLTSEEKARKPMLKLTEKECERFHVTSKLALNDSDIEDNSSPFALDEIYGDLGPVSPEDDLAPKSPEEVPSTHSPAPIIIPAEPVNAQSVTPNSDVDMRILSPPNDRSVLTGGLSTCRRDLQSGNSKNPPTRPSDTPNIPLLGDPPKKPLLADPRVRRDMSRPNLQNSPNPYAHPDRILRHGNYSNMTPNRTPSYTPSFDTDGPGTRPNITSSRILSTPSYTPFENEEDMPARKHVYAPIVNYDRDTSVNRENPRENPRWELNDSKPDHRRPRWEHPEGRFDDQHSRSTSVHRDGGPDQRSRYGSDTYDPRNDRYHRGKRDRIDCPRTPVHPFGRDTAPLDCPRTPVHPFGRSDGPASINCPRTPVHPFGREGSVPNPVYCRRESQRPHHGRYVTNANHPFDQSDAPLTPGPSFGRSDASLTPGPSFGRGDAPLTPGPSFGRYEAPLTPGPSFGRSDGSSTPSHPFSRGEYSRADMPMTPIHHFGRSDASMTPGRYDQSSHNQVKDPRLNRNNEHDGRGRRFERNADSFDRQESSRGRSRHNYGREKSVDRNKTPYDKNDRPYREPSVGREMNRQASYDRNQRAPSAKRSFGANDDVGSRDFGKRRDFVRSQSVGRSDNRRERALSVSRDYKKNNTLSVAAQSGRSFVIDTSVNSTFQQFMNKKGLQEFGFVSFDDRKKRASSVGRFLATTTSDNQKQVSGGPSRRPSTYVHQDSYSQQLPCTDNVEDTSGYKAMVNFVRARSVGRDLTPVTKEKTFAEIKNDLKSFSTKSKLQKREKVQSVEREMNYRDPRTRKNYKLPEKISINTSSYSPRKNNRDPRMHREDRSDRKYDNRQKSYGIVYSNDNIARGSLLNPAYGVKNYKIPKIKKPEPEAPPVKEDTPEKSNEIVKGKNKSIDYTDKKSTDKKTAVEKNHKKVSADKIDKKVFTEKTRKNMATNKLDKKVSVVLERAKLSKPIETKEMVTRKEKYVQEYDDEKETSKRKTRTSSRRRSISISGELQQSDSEITIQRKPKKAVIESDSEETDESNKPSQSNKYIKQDKCDKLPTSTKIADSKDVQKASKDVVSNGNDDDDLFDGSFTIDDLDISSDPNINEKSLIENINSLIDDLDNDLNTKNDCTQDMESDSNLLEGSVSVSPGPFTDITIKNVIFDELNDVSEVITKDLTETSSSDPTDVLNTKIQSVPEKVADKMKSIPEKIPDNIQIVPKEKADDIPPVPQKISDPVKIQSIPEKTADKIQPVPNKMADKIQIVPEEKANDIQQVPQKISDPVKIQSIPETAGDKIQPVPNKIADKIQPVPDKIVDKIQPVPQVIAVPVKMEPVIDKIDDKNKLITTDDENLPASIPIQAVLTNSKTQDKDIGVKLPQIAITKLVDTNERQDIVTTTDSENDSPVLDEKLEFSPDKFDLSQPTDDKERCSTPDSTINTADPEIVEPKSKDVVHLTTENISDTINEMNPQVTSTHDPQEGPGTSGSETPRPTTQIESIGNLLSILQDKSKIKELLSMLDQSSETEKIKKKLEKLSEIVSDEDESKNYEETEKNSTEKRASAQPEASSESDAKSVPDAISETKLQVGSAPEKTPEESDNTTGKIDTELENSKVENSEGNESNSLLSLTQSPETVKKTLKKGKKGKFKKGKNKKVIPNKAKRMTRSEAAKPKESRELKQLQEDIKEMFIKDDVMNATGIRVCRLAKLVDEKRSEQDDDSDTTPKEKLPVVILQKYRDEPAKDTPPLKVRKKPGPKPKPKMPDSQDQGKSAKKGKVGPRNKPGPKPKRKVTEEDSDPYAFETDSVSDVTTLKSFDSSTIQESSDSENESLASSKSFGSSEVILADLKKKPKRKRRPGWQSGIIAKRKKKNDTKMTDRPETPAGIEHSDAASEKYSRRKVAIPDTNCYIDPTYCFRECTTEYSCRLCEHVCSDIVHHYKKQHPHSEIPLSRLSPKIASNAIEQSAYADFQAISKVPSDRYVCRFCFKDFGKQNTSALETFFWHVVSTHTGEYKQLCPECLNITRCPFNLDIPAPPKEVKGQLIGYICEKCNFTQISLENLKTHVTVRHNDEHTSVCMINLAAMTAKTLQKFTKKSQYLKEDVPRTLRSSNQSSIGVSDDHTDISEKTGYISDKDSTKQEAMPEPLLKNRVAKLTFEDESDTEFGTLSSVKIEREDESAKYENLARNDDVCDYPHFKVWFSESGIKEYVCCINGQDNHYKTALFISMKRHIQTKHIESWDGYCFICKVIVTSQGRHTFKDCFQHCVDKHTDNLPPWDSSKNQNEGMKDSTSAISEASICARPAKQLLPSVTLTPTDEVLDERLPTIENVMSIAPTDPLLKISDTQEIISTTIEESETSIETPLPPMIKKIGAVPEETYKYEEVQAEVMAKKHHVVLQTMMSKESLARIYKCAGRYCSYTSDAAEAAWSHASTHQRNGGENALVCSYCDFDCKGNASDLVTHVFKSHGSCQFACSMCFYRAAASRLVQSHIFRGHPQMWNQVKVLESTTPRYGTQDPVAPLQRELAVKYYICANDEGNCKYKTFIMDKFNEHIAKHSSPYVCSICSTSLATVGELTRHLKGHGMNMYQCTWCVHGAENETELLAHASACHPARQPQAYVRTVNSKDAVKQMVLPLAKFNKSNVQTEVINTSDEREDPIREAERSIDLEKLIGSVSGSASAVETRQETITEIDEDNSYEVPPSPYQPEPEVNIPEPPKVPSPTESLDSRKTPVLKTERADDSPVREIPIVQEVINLDSDDDEPAVTPAKTVVDLSKDDTPSTSRSLRLKRGQFDKIPLAALLKCPRCYVTCKTLPAFKRHMTICYQTQVSKVRCAHCPYQAESKDSMYIHYTCDHGTAIKETEMLLLNKRDTKELRRSNEAAQLTPMVNMYKCGECELRDPLLSAIRTHMRNEHNLTNLTVSHKHDKNYEYTVSESPTPTKKPSSHKRKLSVGNAEPQQKRIRYSLLDLDKLPVKPILDNLAFCAECEFNTKVRLNLVRHLQQHADNRHIVPSTVPLNPVPHLETNEKHFDKMVNLASSSSETSRLEKQATRTENAEYVAPEVASRYPKFVPDRQRHTCGAKGCSYISVDQAMLKRHWEALHDGSNDYHCVHCPPYQQLDTSTPLTAARIISHLKMHDTNMYACSTCPYYHHKRNILEKHLNEAHRDSGKVLIVREENSYAPTAVPSISKAPAFGPTMDLKPWQCGLCEYKSLLRPEVVEHCSKQHNTKMQFKCPNCPFRASTLENVSKHKSKSHPDSTEDVFYYFYREGSIPDEPDGTHRWQKQRQKMGNPESEVKTEDPQADIEPVAPLGPISAPPVVDLNKVKQEKPDPEIELLTLDKLYLKYGKLCEPTGLKYKCPLCKVFVENSKDVMQSHLFEELQYRKWGCSVCPYKAFHKKGLTDHMFLEHHQRTTAPILLPVDKNLEKWVTTLLDAQTKTIEMQKDAILKQKLQNTTPTSRCLLKTALLDVNEKEMKNLQQAFGDLGTSKDCFFCCPKCDYQSKDEGAFKDHLEIELNKIRWRCSRCPNASQNYHEAQMHSKTCNYGTAGGPARPMEAIRDPVLRNSWVNTAILLQKKTMNIPEDQQMVPDDMTPAPAHLDLLVVRYEERVPTPEEEMLKKKSGVTPLPSTSTLSEPEPDPESDDERLFIDDVKPHEPKSSTVIDVDMANPHQCPYCDYSSKYAQCLRIHTLKHYNLKPMQCDYCEVTCDKTIKSRVKHTEMAHPGKNVSFKRTPIPTEPPTIKKLVANTAMKRRASVLNVEPKTDKAEEDLRDICLVCEKYVAESEKESHPHNNTYAVKGQVLVKCCTCLSLFLDLAAMQEHQTAQHPAAPLNYAYFKLYHDTREILVCRHCNKSFKFKMDLKAHNDVVHGGLRLKYETKPYNRAAHEVLDISDDSQDNFTPTENKRAAKKSTTKLPSHIAKKSTTKLPFRAVGEDDSTDSVCVENEFSYSGAKPAVKDNLEEVKTTIPDSETPCTV